CRGARAGTVGGNEGRHIGRGVDEGRAGYPVKLVAGVLVENAIAVVLPPAFGHTVRDVLVLLGWNVGQSRNEVRDLRRDLSQRGAGQPYFERFYSRIPFSDQLVMARSSYEELGGRARLRCPGAEIELVGVR